MYDSLPSLPRRNSGRHTGRIRAGRIDRDLRGFFAPFSGNRLREIGQFMMRRMGIILIAVLSIMFLRTTKDFINQYLTKIHR